MWISSSVSLPGRREDKGIYNIKIVLQPLLQPLPQLETTKTTKTTKTMKVKRRSERLLVASLQKEVWCPYPQEEEECCTREVFELQRNEG